MMIWVDLRKFLEAPTWEAERKLWHRLADEQRVILTPGASFAPSCVCSVTHAHSDGSGSGAVGCLPKDVHYYQSQ
jgi:hypothetical protein